MRIAKIIFYALTLSIFCTSCIGIKDLKYLQSSENLKLNEYGLIPVVYETYRIKKDDVLAMTVITTDPDVTKLLTNENTTVFKGGVDGAADSRLRTSGLIVDPDGYISVYGLGEFYVYGLTIKEVTDLIQDRLNQVLYNEGKAEVRINLGSIKYYMIGEIGAPGEKIEQSNRLDLLQAIAKAGDLTRFANRRQIRIIREYPEGKKNITLDITKDDIMNSPYFYVQSGDQIIVDPLRQKVTGIGGGTNLSDVLQILSFGSLILQNINTYLLFKNL